MLFYDRGSEQHRKCNNGFGAQKLARASRMRARVPTCTEEEAQLRRQATHAGLEKQWQLGRSMGSARMPSKGGKEDRGSMKDEHRHQFMREGRWGGQGKGLQ